jgi:hypothetical protein
MGFNKLVKFLLEGGFTAPVGTKRPVKAPNMPNHGTVNPLFGNKYTPSAYSGFKGDRLNPSMSVISFRLPRKKKKKR